MDAKYIIVGAGLAGGSAVDGIREVDKDGSILLVGAEKHNPYHRPPLSKQLWSKKKSPSDIFLHDAAHYDSLGAQVLLNTQIVDIDGRNKSATDNSGRVHQFEKLLIATGGAPRRLPIPGGDLPGLLYYRTMDDYMSLEPQVEGAKALIIGGGFIGSEMAASLHQRGAHVTILFPEPYLVHRVFPERLGMALTELYRGRGIEIITEDQPAAIEQSAEGYVTKTKKGREIVADAVLVGIGIAPGVELADRAGITVENGIVIDEHLCSSHPDVFAAGDNANFPYEALGQRMRVEHWDNAMEQGKLAGRNMAGAAEAYTHMPYFFSDLFEFGYEAVGEVSSALENHADWEEEYKTGVIYYLRDGKIRGAMMCNIWDKVQNARDLILAQKPVQAAELAGSIR